LKVDPRLRRNPAHHIERGIGVIDVAILGIIRRWHLRDQVPLREIAKRLGISRNTVRRYLRSKTTGPAFAQRQSASAIGPYAFQLSGWLKTEAAKSRQQRRTLKQLHEDLTELGFKGSYDRVAAFARRWREGQTEWVNLARKRTHEVPYVSQDIVSASRFEF
jgi:transcriptional regulator with XRE-family HTH domain